MDRTKPLLRLFVLTAAVGLVFAASVPGAIGVAAAGNEALDGAGNQSLSVGVQQGAGSVTVSVSHNGSAVGNATVDVTANDSYDGTGTYTTDDAGTVSLPEPTVNGTVEATITAEKDNLTGSKTVTLRGNEGQGAPFVPLGQRIAAFVHGLKGSGGVVAIGPFVADYVHALVPAGGPANAGPPPWISDVRGPPGGGNDERGPPDHAGPPGDDDGNSTEASAPGPPDHAGPQEDEDRGPPDHAGPSDDGADDGEDDEKKEKATGDDEGDEDGEDEEEDDDGGHGPPDDKPGKGKGRG